MPILSPKILPFSAVPPLTPLDSQRRNAVQDKPNSPGSPIRLLFVLTVLACLFCSIRLLAAEKPKLFVFVPSDQKTRTLEKTLRGSMTQLQVTVFGKSRDFERAVSRDNPAAIMALQPQLAALGVSAKIKGVQDGGTSEPYVLVSVDSAVSPSALNGETVGALGILSRGGMKELCSRLLGTGSQKVKTVTKYEDLLPLLQFKSAKAVILPKRLTKVLTERSQLKLVVSSLPGGKVGVAAVGIKDAGAGGTVTSAIKGMDSKSKKYLGVDSWR